MRYINAGHIPPILYQKASDTIVRLEEGGTVLGLFDIAQFTEGEAELNPGDILVVFTDGISEAWDANDEEYGEDRLAELIRDNASLDAAELEELIQKEVDTFTDGAPPTDDKTIIVVKRT
jgi:sigma-B regulation protein RsbU (phosphoserine phosphatase)